MVLVTGAGGSIGSELCRQILAERPRQLLLLDHGEFNLYSVHQELRGLCAAGRLRVELVPLLGSVVNPARLHEICRAYHPYTVYHAAAYKHVPMVESNPAEGIFNNVFGTLNMARAALDSGVAHFVLVSTDKAVRPTNIMGASKRMAELVLQTLSEAAQLVLQAGAMAAGGEVFVLDMGEPVKILDLAHRMVELSGLSVRDEAHPEGDIAISVTGLRPGEKLYEELLIGDNPTPTGHPRIMKARENCLDWPVLEQYLQTLNGAAQAGDVTLVKTVLRACVQGYGEQDLSLQESIPADL